MFPNMNRDRERERGVGERGNLSLLRYLFFLILNTNKSTKVDKWSNPKKCPFVYLKHDLETSIIKISIIFVDSLKEIR